MVTVDPDRQGTATLFGLYTVCSISSPDGSTFWIQVYATCQVSSPDLFNFPKFSALYVLTTPSWAPSCH